MLRGRCDSVGGSYRAMLERLAPGIFRSLGEKPRAVKSNNNRNETEPGYCVTQSEGLINFQDLDPMPCHKVLNGSSKCSAICVIDSIRRGNSEKSPIPERQRPLKCLDKRKLGIVLRIARLPSQDEYVVAERAERWNYLACV